jgi:hypothetical protein
MDYLILSDDNGGTARLTTDSPASSYGIPVLVLDADDIRGEFGPADTLPTDQPLTGADLVATWGSEPERTEEERTAAGRFLRQWPDGPQLES